MGLVRMEEWLCPQHGRTLLPTHNEPFCHPGPTSIKGLSGQREHSIRREQSWRMLARAACPECVSHAPWWSQGEPDPAVSCHLASIVARPEEDWLILGAGCGAWPRAPVACKSNVGDLEPSHTSVCGPKFPSYSVAVVNAAARLPKETVSPEVCEDV